MPKLTCACSQLAVKQFGQPQAFVDSLFSGPADTAELFEEESIALDKKLFEEDDFCRHYRQYAVNAHIGLTNGDDRDNRLFFRTLCIARAAKMTVTQIQELGGVSLPN